MSEIENEGEGDRVQLQISESSSDEPIWGTRPQRRRKRKRAYLDFAEVNKVFPDVSTEVACQLAEMTTVKPSEVLKLVPGRLRRKSAHTYALRKKMGRSPRR